MAVIKANGYGHGAVTVARALESADAFAVARLAEAVELRDAGVTARLVLLGGFMDREELEVAVSHRLDLSVHNLEQIALIEALSASSGIDVWLKLDTGMGRLGLSPDAMPAAIARLQHCAVVRSVTPMTHLACADDCADDLTGRQVERFAGALRDWRGDISIANSAAILAWPAARDLKFGGHNWVRPGIMLYGASPLAGRPAAALGLQPAMSLEAPLISVKPLAAGESVGYGRQWTAARDSVIGIAAVGYADGYPRRLASGTPVRVGSATLPLVGRVSMDSIAIDLTDRPSSRVGERVTLWGASPSIDDIAQRAGTIAYELLSGVTARVPRVEC